MDSPGSSSASTRIPSASRELIAIERGWLSAAQVEECMLLHQTLLDMGLASSLGEVLLRKGYLSEAQLAELDVALGARPAISIPGYEIVEKIAEGGMGAVYKARQTSMDRDVAIKLLLPKFATDHGSRERLIREARAVAKLSHPNVVAGIDAGEAAGVCYFVMEFIDGVAMDHVLRERGRLPWREATEIVRQVAAALEHAEQHGIVHRDVKPGNILLLKNGRAKLADLGLARVAGNEESQLTQSGMIVGSPAYLSPEQATADRVLDVRSDIFSLGLTYFEFVAGERAFAGVNPMSVLTALLTRDVAVEKLAAFDAPSDVGVVVRHMVERDPARRYASAQHLLADLDAVLAGATPAHASGAGASALATTAAHGAVRPALPVAASKPQPGERSRPRVARWLLVVALVLVLAWQVVMCLGPDPAGVAPAAGGAVPLPARRPEQMLPVTLLAATATALTRIGNNGVAYHSELEDDEYSIDVAVAQRAFNVQINGRSGAVEAVIEEHEDRSMLVAMSKISIADAVHAALKAHPGEPMEAEILLLPGLTVIEVKLMRDSGPIWVDVDATTSAVSAPRNKPRPSP